MANYVRLGLVRARLSKRELGLEKMGSFHLFPLLLKRTSHALSHTFEWGPENL